MNDRNTNSENVNKIELPEPNPVTAKRHRNQYRRQILFPILIGVFLLTIIIVIIGIFGIGTPERWATISAIFLFMPLLLVGLVLLAILVFLIMMMGELMGVLPRYTHLAQNAVEKIKEQVEAGADISARPVIQLRSYLAWIERLFGFVKKNKEDL